MAEEVKKPGKAALHRTAIRRQAYLRAVIQLIFFICMPSAFAAAFSGVRYIFTQIGSGGVIETNDFVWVLVFLCLFTMLFGRFFCGYLCAFGALGDLVYYLSGRLQTGLFHRKKQLHMGEVPLRLLRKVKYLILCMFCLLCAGNLYDVLKGSSPWDVFSMVTSFRIRLAGYFPGLILLILILLGMALQERFFCQILCPMGAAFALLPQLPCTLLKRNESTCGKNCRVCRSVCPIDMRPERDGRLMGECIRCGKCSVNCPRENIYSLKPSLHGSEWQLAAVKAVIFFAAGILLKLFRFA